MATLEKVKQKKSKNSSKPSKSKNLQKIKADSKCLGVVDDIEIIDEANCSSIEKIFDEPLSDIINAENSGTSDNERDIIEQSCIAIPESSEAPQLDEIKTEDEHCNNIVKELEENFSIKEEDKSNVIAKDNGSKTENICDIQSDLTLINDAVLPSTSSKQVTPVIYPELPKEEQSVKINKIDFIKPEPIKPFTKSQLAALYNNPELNASKEFLLQFLDNELSGVKSKNHYLYELLTNYLHAREKLQETTIEINQLKRECNKSQDEVWLVKSEVVKQKGQCHNVSVVASHERLIAIIQNNHLDNIRCLQNKIKQLVNENYTLYSYTTSLLKLKIDSYLTSVQNNCQKSLGISSGNPKLLAVLKSESCSDPVLRELRLCISVLFSFQRNFLKDQQFVKETREWLSNTIAVLLRVADWQDHHFLLNQVLRCPAGIGSWATSFIQVPVPDDINYAPFSNKYVNHILAILNILLCPIQKRNQFLEQMLENLQESVEAVPENLWTLVDSDGEEDENNSYGLSALKENDLVALLNQIPIADLFRIILLLCRKDDQDVFYSVVDEHHMLRLLSFCTVLVQMLEQGLETYNTLRYHQFAKRLCRLIRHTLQYTSDLWEIFRNDHKSCVQDSSMFERLQIEFDAFFLRSTSCLYRAQKLGAWQFLAVAPFHTVSIDTLWQFVYMLHQGVHNNDNNDAFDRDLTEIKDFKSKLSETSSLEQFSDKLSVMSVEESYYLLNTFANMIMARSSADEVFIEFLTLTLLQCGFSFEAENQESSCKCAGILISNITTRYPSLISNILTFVRNTITELNKVLFLFSELPLHLWKPKEKDVDIIVVWLLQNQISSLENSVARKILSNLNWNFESSNELFLPVSLHRRIAILTLEAVEKHASLADNTGFLDGMKQVVGQLSPEQHFVKWAWQLIYKLRLHATARATSSVIGVPELLEVDILQKSTRANRPLGCYVALAMTSVGHLLPLVCSEGLTFLETLVSSYKYDAVLIALHDIIPLFITSADNLLMCTSFQSIIANLLSADRTYMKMAKNLIVSDFPGTVIRQFANMINSHIHNPHWYPLMEFWVRTLICVSNWNKDPGVLYLLNIIVRIAFFIPECYQAVSNVFNELLEKATDRNSNSNSSLLSWVPLVGGSNSVGSALVLGPNVALSEPWLLYLIISIEFEHVELRTGLWPELLKQLYSNTGKTNVDASLKKAASIVKVPTYTSNGLCLYRWAQLALDTSFDHPLLPLIWQKFFSLFLARVPSNTSDHTQGSVGSKFFDGVVNTSLSKRIKKRLESTVEFFQNKLKDLENEELQNRSNIEFHQKCLAIFSSFVLWLEEPLLQEATLYLPSLPPQYEPRYLSYIIQNTLSPWTEFVNFDFIHNEYEKSLNEWIALTNRTQKSSRWVPLQTIKNGENIEPLERIRRRLASYDKPLPPPEIVQNSFNIPVINITSAESVSSTLRTYIEKLHQFSEIYTLQISEHGALNCQYMELIMQLYITSLIKINKKMSCKSNCSRPAIITLTFEESRINESVQHQLKTNRTNIKTLLSRILQPPPNSMSVLCASIEETIDYLHQKQIFSLQEGNYELNLETRSISVELFYHLLFTFNEGLKIYPPTLHLFNNCLEKLGRLFIYGFEQEAVRLIKTILQYPDKGNLLTQHFCSDDLSTDVILKIYSDICNKVTDCPDVTFALLSKLDIQKWLVVRKPRLVDRSKFIQLIFKSLIKWPTPTEQQNKLHEIFRLHLVTIFRYDFPEHYGEILMLLLQHSASQSLTVSIWMDLLNVLTYPIIINADGNLMKEQLRAHATQQRLLHASELIETIRLLANYFAQERLQFGLYGLYPKYRLYIEPISLIIAVTLHALIVAVVEEYGSATLADTLFSIHIWPSILDAFVPWLQPYSVKDCKDVTATWIKQLSDDRTVLLPWIQADISNAKKFLNMFVTCVDFISNTLPACSNLYNFVWQFYATNYPHSTIKEHIWNVVHESFSTLEWERFWPTLADLEMMLKIIEQYIPQCHTFLGKIFLEVNWPFWVARLAQNGDAATMSRALECLLHLLVKISLEPNVRLTDRARNLIENSREFAWSLVNLPILEQVLNWYIMSSDVRVVLLADPAIKQIDYSVFGLLKVVSYYDYPQHIMSQSLTIVIIKRQCFIRAYIKMLHSCSNRYSKILTATPQVFMESLNQQLDYLEKFLLAENIDNQSDQLVSEFLTLLNMTNLSNLALICFENWLKSRSAGNPILHSVIRKTATVVSSTELAGSLLEAAFNSYFSLTMVEAEPPCWSKAAELLVVQKPRFDETLTTFGFILTLHALLLKNIPASDDTAQIEIALKNLIERLTALKVTDLSECKILLLWRHVIRFALCLCYSGNEVKAAIHLKKFITDHLLVLSENRSAGQSSTWGFGLLGAIGLGRPASTSIHFRFICRATAGYLLAQLPEPRGEPQSVRCFAGASNPVGHFGGNTECAKILLKLDFGNAELRSHAELALKRIQDPQNSLHNAESFVFDLVDVFYTKSYLKLL